jgi:hypothetical protein
MSKDEEVSIAIVHRDRKSVRRQPPLTMDRGGNRTKRDGFVVAADILANQIEILAKGLFKFVEHKHPELAAMYGSEGC